MFGARSKKRSLVAKTLLLPQVQKIRKCIFFIFLHFTGAIAFTCDRRCTSKNT